jgi:hypothetical protein
VWVVLEQILLPQEALELQIVAVVGVLVAGQVLLVQAAMAAQA